MSDPWIRLHAAFVDALDWIWERLAKQGEESGVLAPLGTQSPGAAGWLVACTSSSNDSVTRKIGAMLAGWLNDPRQAEFLAELLDIERGRYAQEPHDANSVVEDIMFSATRWSRLPPGEVQAAGVLVLSAIVSDALEGPAWNTAHWAAANLYDVTSGNHETIERLRHAPPQQLERAPFLAKFVAALQSGDQAQIDRYITAPAPLYELPANIAGYEKAQELWEAAQAAENTLVKEG